METVAIDTRKITSCTFNCKSWRHPSKRWTASKTAIMMLCQHLPISLINVKGIDDQQFRNYSFIRYTTRSRNFTNEFINGKDRNKLPVDCTKERLVQQKLWFSMVQNFQNSKIKDWVLNSTQKQIGEILLLVGIFLTWHEFPDTWTPQGPQRLKHSFSNFSQIINKTSLA